MEIVGVIPARYSSSRLPGKPLIKIRGTPLIEWTFRNASKSKIRSRIIVATDDRRIFNTVQKFGGLLGTDGVHFSDAGYAMVANLFIDAINAELGLDIPPIDLEPIVRADRASPAALVDAGLPIDQCAR